MTVAISGADLRQPNLVVVDSQDGTACLVYSQRATTGVTGPVTQVGCFPAWGAWPPATPVGVNAHSENTDAPVPGDSILAASQFAPPAPYFALLYIGTTVADGSGNYLSPATGYGDATTPWTVRIDDGAPLFLTAAPAPDKKTVLAGLSVPPHQGAEQKGSFSLSLALMQATQGANLFSLTCATTPIAADAVGTSAGWLIGVAHSGPAKWMEGCLADPAGLGPATTIDFGTFSWRNGGWSPMMSPLTTASPVSRIRMAARSDGAWAVFHLDGAPTLVGARVVPATQTVEPFPIGSVSSPDSAFQVAPIGDGFVLQTTNTAIAGDDEIQLDHFDAGGTLTWSKSLTAVGSVDGPVSLLASSDGRGLLAAWSELPEGASARDLRVARLDCAPGPGGP